jgi:hypothetical protein
MLKGETKNPATDKINTTLLHLYTF